MREGGILLVCRPFSFIYRNTKILIINNIRVGITYIYAHARERHQPRVIDIHTNLILVHPFHISGNELSNKKKTQIYLNGDIYM